MKLNPKLIRWSLVAALGILVLGVGSLEAAQKVWVVGKDCKTIQGCINQAGRGETVSVPAGTYTENLIIDRSLKLSGAGRDTTVVKGIKGSWPVICIGREWMERCAEITGEVEITIEGLTITEAKVADTKTYAEDGIRVLVLSKAAKVTIQNARISNNGDDGISVGELAQATIQDTEILGNGGNGISVWRTAQVTIHNAQISRNRGSGIEVWDWARLEKIENNTVTNNEVWGISAFRLENIGICQGNTLSGNKRGDYGGAAKEKCK